jgi:hypothetical protein
VEATIEQMKILNMNFSRECNERNMLAGKQCGNYESRLNCRIECPLTEP